MIFLSLYDFLIRLNNFIFSAKLDGVKTYMRIRKVPSNIQIKVIKWFDYLWMSQKNADEDKSINCLPGDTCSASAN